MKLIKILSILQLPRGTSARLEAFVFYFSIKLELFERKG